jgi:hypothetical protein
MDAGNEKWLGPKIPIGGYLVSDEANFVTGANLVVDGRFIA